jgi:tartrate dehydrogenase/decarboxylase/D-malate dehydrogenase
MKTYRLACIPGDGIGNEVMPEGLRVLRAAAAAGQFRIETEQHDWSCERYKATGAMMPEDGIARLGQSDAVFLGAVGFPGVPDHVSLWGLLVPIRREFDQYVNLRPVRLLPGVPCPLKDKAPGDIDFWVVRENTEGEYSQIGGTMFTGTDREFVSQVAVFSRHGCDRISRYAFELARKLGAGRVDMATKSNGIFVSMPYWDRRFREVAKEYPGIETREHHIDILTARLVMAPEQFRVIVATNLFGDILSDLGPGVTGTIAVAPSANINPERRFPSMFEPVHGSAPDIAGQGIANPVGQIWSGAMLLEHLGEAEAAAAIVRAIERVLGDAKGPKTRDLGGRAGTEELGRTIADAVAADA